MLAPPVRELMRFSSDICCDINATSDVLVVKGFASVKVDDRSGDITDPMEFNVDEFMASPTLLLNHKYWQDHSGNESAIGRITKMHQCVLQKSSNPEMWSVKCMTSKEVIDEYPKVKVPRLGIGDTGLFVHAEVMQPEVQMMIKRGEIGSMSWRGLVEVDYGLTNDHRTQRILKNIDLYEVSLVNIPDNNQSTFVLIKKNADGETSTEEIDFSNWTVNKVTVPKATFSKNAAIEYFETHGFKETDHVVAVETDSTYGVAIPNSNLDCSKTVKIKMGKSVLFMAPPKNVSSNGLVAEFVGNSSSAVHLSLSNKENISMSDQPNKDAVPSDATATEDVTKSTVVEEVESTDTEENTTEVEKTGMEDKKKMGDKLHMGDKLKTAGDKEKGYTKKTAEEQLEGLGTHIATSVANSLAPSFEAFTDSMSEMTQAVAKMAAGISAEPSTDTDTENLNGKDEIAKSAATEPSFSDVMGVLNGLAQNLETTQAQVAEVAKSAIALGASIPNAGLEREESSTQEVQKSAVSGKPVKDDSNSVLDGAFPWLAG